MAERRGTWSSGHRVIKLWSYWAIEDIECNAAMLGCLPCPSSTVRLFLYPAFFEPCPPRLLHPVNQSPPLLHPIIFLFLFFFFLLLLFFLHHHHIIP